MHVTVAGKQVQTGEALQSKVRDDLALLAQKYFDHAVEANVTFSRDRSRFGCDINFKAGRGLLVRGEGEGADAHRAFETAAEHMAKRLRRMRRRFSDHPRDAGGLGDDGAGGEMPADAADGAAHATAAAMLRAAGKMPPNGHAGGAANGAAHHDADEESPEAHGAIVAERPAALAQLTVGEAAQRLEATTDPVLLFREAASGAVNVVYRRADGCIGWIEAG